MDDFKELLPLVQELGNSALQARHWQDIFDIIGADIPPNDQGVGEPHCNSTGSNGRHLGSQPQRVTSFRTCATTIALLAVT